MDRENRIYRVNRRQFLKLAAGGVAALTLARRPAAASTYRVGVGHHTDSYTATMRAISASDEWVPGMIYGRTVIIKPNLLVGTSPDSGIITDAQVVRAIVDLALAAGAFKIRIVEGSPGGSNFSACGYDFLQDYGGSGRVSLVDLDSLPVQSASIDGGLAYEQITMPEMVLQPNTYLISVGKLKTHAETLATLATKNIFGLPPVSHYSPPGENGRFAMHYRGVNQATVDLNLARPIDFAVVDGIWGMEGLGPYGGTPVRMDTVVAGANAVAVDRVCMEIMSVPQLWVQHLTYAARLGLGPASLDSVQVAGDPVTPRAFSLPTFPPQVEYPRLSPAAFDPAGGQQTSITTWVSRPCQARVEIVRTSDSSTDVTHVRWLRNWTSRPAGIDTLAWDGRDDSGEIVAPGRYTVRVEADGQQPARNAFATSKVEVAELVNGRLFLPSILG